jgi:hypothetical protein
LISYRSRILILPCLALLFSRRPYSLYTPTASGQYTIDTPNFLNLSSRNMLGTSWAFLSLTCRFMMGRIYASCRVLAYIVHVYRFHNLHITRVTHARLCTQLYIVHLCVYTCSYLHATKMISFLSRIRSGRDRGLCGACKPSDPSARRRDGG